MSATISFVRFLLRLLATVRLAREKPIVVGVTGSVGKTSTKEAVWSVLHSSLGDRVRKSPGNMNTEEGVPLSVLGVHDVPTRWRYPWVLLQSFLGTLFLVTPPKQPILIQELGAEKPGDIGYLVNLLKPYLKIGIITTVGPIHLDPGQFVSVAEIAKEKSKLIEALPADGWAVLNEDNQYTRSMAAQTKAKVVWFSDRGLESAREIATVVADLFHVEQAKAREALESFARPYGRFNELAGFKKIRLFDDSYNANPMSMEQALSWVGNKKGRRLAVLGDMLELGSDEKIYHQQIGKFAKQKVDLVVGVGRRARWYLPTYWFATPSEAAHFLKRFVRPNDLVLVKGSQSMRMEIVSEALLANARDVEKLPRQTAAWKGKAFVQP